MHLTSIGKVSRVLSIILLLNIGLEIIFPSVAFALTSGPNQPEFTSFEPVSSSNMVDDFSGDFTYNLPVLEVPGVHGSGYALSLSYHSGGTPEEESSWVGYGWTLNPGAINRNTRGFPDDFKDEPITYHNKRPKNWTVSTTAGIAPEIFGTDLAVPSGTFGLRYNNYRGFGYNAGLGLKLGKGLLNLGYNISDGEGSYSLNVNPVAILNNLKSGSATKAFVSRIEKSALKNLFQKSVSSSSISLAGSNYSLFTYSEAVRPTTVSEYTGGSFNFTTSVTLNPGPVPVGMSGNVGGSYSFQRNEEDYTLNAFGFAYSAEAQGNNDAVRDYYVEKESAYDKRDVFLGMPFNNADNFMVSGEGIGGGFRVYHKNIGGFAPNTKESKTTIGNLGGEIAVGADFGVGFDGGFGLGGQTFSEGEWSSSDLQFSSFEDSEDEPMFFRYNHDLGGNWVSDGGDIIEHARISGGGRRGNKSFSPNIDHISTSFNDGERSGRSSFIEYAFNKDIAEDVKGINHYSKRADIEAHLSRASKAQDGIGEFAMTNEDGLKYVYALPIYSQNEKSLQYGYKRITSGEVKENYLLYKDVTDPSTKIGEERPAPYATSYLLTEIRTSDYIDRTLDGPTPDDLGGYTRFNYNKLYGDKTSKGNHYKWRVPYNGLLYQKNSLSDQRDDMGSVSEGEKEVYYLQSVETNTHAAIFETSERKDGLDAHNNASTAASSPTAKGSNALLQLNKIHLYKLEDVERNGNQDLVPKTGVKPIKTINFQYNHTLFANESGGSRGLPNSENTAIGKLTLKKVWFTYNGLENVKVSPYTFKYHYPFQDVAAGSYLYPEKYRQIEEEYNHLSAGNQNPPYSPFDLDAWGNYQHNGKERFANMQNWLKQNPSTEFDPAAWQLKAITLPSGGEIHVQYEQDDYAFVQNKRAHIMMSVLNDPSKLPRGKPQRFYLNTADAGITSSEDLYALKELIEEQYVSLDGSKKIYFKFLYNLLGLNTPNIDECNADYISGYGAVNDVGIDEEGRLFLDLGIGEESKHSMPYEVCEDFVKTQRAGNLSSSGNCDPSAVGIGDDSDVAKIVNKILGFAKFVETSLMPLRVCVKLNPELSYFRVPVVRQKKGGGLRVKRLLMYEKGLEANPVLYGKEYIYKKIDEATGDVISSGVATNEPGTIREENILVDRIDRLKQKTISRIISGRDKKQVEGPLGESIYPGASVGYSRIAIRDIHSGKTNTGFEVREYLTAKDYPVKVTKTQILTQSDYKKKFAILYIEMINNLWATQGFKFELNGMHGKLKRSATYSGNYEDYLRLSNATKISEQVLSYYEPGEAIPVSSSFAAGVTYEHLGKEMDVTLAHKAVKDKSTDTNIENDFSIGLWGFFPIPFVTAIPFVSKTEMEMYTHATTKIIRYPAIVKKEQVYQDGIYHNTEYLAFDKFSGKPVSTKSYDEFKGTYLAQRIPASWEYENFKPMAQKQGLRVSDSENFAFINEAGKDYLGFNAANTCQLMADFTRGDLLDLGNGALYHVKGHDYFKGRLELLASQAGNGAPSITSFKEVVIVKSGRNNQLNTDAGQITLHSQTQDIKLPDVNEPNRLIGNENTFINDLNNGFASANGASGSFALSGTYQDVNIGSFVSELPPECAVDIAAATIKGIEFNYETTSNAELVLKIMFFEVQCTDGSWVKVIGDQVAI